MLAPVAPVADLVQQGNGFILSKPGAIGKSPVFEWYGNPTTSTFQNESGSKILR
jgi:hypothetical protein